MASEFHSQQTTPKIDPYRHTLVLALPLAIGAIVAVVLGGQSLTELLSRRASKGAWIEAILFGALAVFQIAVLVRFFRRWRNRITGDVAVVRAQAAIVQAMPLGSTVFLKPKPTSNLPTKVVYAAVPAACLGLAFVGLLLGDWLIVWISLGAVVPFGGFIALVLLGERADFQMGLSVDPVRKVVIFENFTFAKKFLPNRSSPRTEVSFDQIIDCAYWPGQKGGPATLRLRTTHGLTTIYERTPNFHSLRLLLENLAILNQANLERHQANLRAEPKASVPVPGWVIVVIALAGFTLWVGLFVYL